MDGETEGQNFFFFCFFLFFFVVWKALIVVGWVAGGVEESCLGLAEITSFVFLALFKDWRRRVRPRFHLFVSDVN